MTTRAKGSREVTKIKEFSEEHCKGVDKISEEITTNWGTSHYGHHKESIQQRVSV
jgi:hypothetical protein